MIKLILALYRMAVWVLSIGLIVCSYILGPIGQTIESGGGGGGGVGEDGIVFVVGIIVQCVFIVTWVQQEIYTHRINVQKV